ncbi:MAG: hypothetical protein J6X53_10140 [Abditibacteriota bacterium]|nr:hypothetical protein [Abditibacteriota bacterium]
MTHDENIPKGISRLRDEWAEFKNYAGTESAGDEVVFPESHGTAGVGDYSVTVEDACSRLALSKEAVERLILCGELDAVTVDFTDGKRGKLISRGSLTRFEEDAQIDSAVTERAAELAKEASLEETLESLRAEVESLKTTQAKQISQIKDVLLLEMRNLKEQDRDLTSFVYELAEEIRNLPIKGRKK